MSDKELVLDLLKRLPADAKLTEIGREIEVLAAIRHEEAEGWSRLLRPPLHVGGYGG